jgi:hypothetical protein
MANKNTSFSSNPTDLLCFGLAQVPRSQDIAIFVLTITTITTRPITLPPCACARGKDREWPGDKASTDLLETERLGTCKCTFENCGDVKEVTLVETTPPGYWLDNHLSTSCFNWKRQNQINVTSPVAIYFSAVIR